VDEAIAYSAIIASYLASCKAIFTYTRTGSTALRISRLRPNIPIYTLTPSKEIEKRIRMCYGVIPIVIRELKNIDEVINEAKGYSRRLGIKGNITIVGGVSSDAEGTTRFLKVEEVN
jgi:pyruvate kinase